MCDLHSGDATAYGILNVYTGASNFLKYLESTWMGAMLPSWSLQGRKRAAELMGVPLDAIPTTNNHVEGFNSALKMQYLPRY